MDNASHGSVQLFTDETSQIITLLPKVNEFVEYLVVQKSVKPKSTLAG